MSDYLFEIKLQMLLNDIVYILGERRLGKKSESQMGLEPTTLRDLVGCSATELLRTL